ncbi:hypothetical protein FRC12_001449 [Ceratobasidium sp. 428]|nr:hypothetical protein FRC12_001449 [Ceratobasidium sp. 428]
MTQAEDYVAPSNPGTSGVDIIVYRDESMTEAAVGRLDVTRLQARLLGVLAALVQKPDNAGLVNRRSGYGKRHAVKRIETEDSFTDSAAKTYLTTRSHKLRHD